MKKNVLNEVMPLGYGHGEFFIEFIYKLSRDKLCDKRSALLTQKADEIPGNSKTAPNIFQFF